MKQWFGLLLMAAVIMVPASAQETPAVSQASPAESVAPAAAAAASEPVATPRSEEELDQLLGRIALHPDPLLAQILTAATQPTDIVLAARYLESNPDSSKVDEQPWDASVKALARFPSVVMMMSEDLAWTVALGNAFFEEPDAVMASVQRLRQKAQTAGNLTETKEQKVVVETVEQETVVKILPADPQIIYVPQYNPQIVYVEKPPSVGSTLFTFVAGVAIGAWLHHDFDWHHHGVVVLPGGWRPGWHRPVIGSTVNVNVNIWRPRPLPGRPLPPAWTRPPGSFSPGWGGVARPPRPSFPRPSVAGPSPGRPGLPPSLNRPSSQRPNPGPARPGTLRPARPAPQIGQTRPTPTAPSRPPLLGKPVPRPSGSVSRPALRPSSPTTRPVRPQTRPSMGSAFRGYGSGQTTRHFSTRGAQSRHLGGARGGKR